MTLRLFCHHGHPLNFTDDLADKELACNRCGSVSMRRPVDTPKSLLDKSTHGDEDQPNTNASDQPPSDEDPLSSLFMTVDEIPSDESAKRKPAIRAKQRPSDPSASRSSASSSERISDKHFEPPQLAGYEIIEELGRGGMGVVYRARDIARGREVALKTLQRMNPESLQRFKAEFRALADIAHPNLASLYELLSDGKTWCFTMEILDGVDFLQYVWSGFESLRSQENQTPVSIAQAAGPRLTEQRIDRWRDVMKQLAIGLDTLHQAGILHTDIKPSNVVMTTEGRLVLLDFGLAAPIDQKHGELILIQGTPPYMSPEQGRGAPLNEASDWYAVGVMIYELLTGRLPFHGKSREVLARKQVETPTAPSELRPDTPEDLSEFCMALLQREAALRPSVSDTLRFLGADDVAKARDASRQAEITQSIDLVGRDRHLEVLRKSFAQVAAGDTLSTFVHGKSGMGKSVLIRRFLNDIKQHSDAVVLEGRCYEQESVPFKALDSLIDSLADYLNTLGTELVHSVMPRDRLALTRVFPVLGGTAEVAGATYPSVDSADQQELRQRAMNALRELLQRLAIRSPLVLYVDDLQWGDVDSAVLLADLVRPPDAPRILLLASYRSEDADRSLCLRAVDDAFRRGRNHPQRTELAIEPLTTQESETLALSLLGENQQANRTYAKKIANESGGLPFFVWELAQHVQEDPGIADQAIELDEVIWVRVTRLPEDTRRMLEMIAVSGRPMPTAEIFQACDAMANGPTLMRQLRASQFVRTTDSQDDQTLVEAYHDRIRESVVNHIEPETVTQWNRSWARTIQAVSGVGVDELREQIGLTDEFEAPEQNYELEREQWQRFFDIAYFYDAAGEHAQAFAYALLAAEQSRMQDGLEVAEQQYRIALRAADTVDPALRFRVLEGLGDVLVMRGRYDEANEQYKAARAMIQGEQTLARMDQKIGVAWLKKGDMGEARDTLERAIGTTGEKPPSSITVLPRAFKEAVVQFLHTKFPSRLVGRRDPTSSQGKLDRLRVRIYDQLTFSYWFTRGMNFVLWSHLRQMNLAEHYPPSAELGKTYAFHAVTMTGVPMAQRGVDYAERAYQISLDKGDLWGQGEARSFQTFALIVLAKFKEGVATGLEAVELLEDAGDVWESNMARMIATVPMYYLGDLKTAYQESKKAYEIGLETGDFSAVCISLLFWIPTNPKTIPEGAIQAELERPREDPLTIAGAVYARGLELLLCEDNPREAAKILQESLDQAKRLGLRNVCLFSAATWKVTALRSVAQREADGPARRKAVADAIRAAKVALKITKKYRACRPHALRERAIIAVLQENETQARRYFDESLLLAESYEARYDHAKTMLALGQAGEQFGWADAPAQIVEATQQLAEMEAFQHTAP
ncbi:MAG: protein kinase [Pirellulaceae bacterium]|nr:protein kinase [Pirellulaceae bacterium]